MAIPLGKIKSTQTLACLLKAKKAADGERKNFIADFYVRSHFATTSKSTTVFSKYTKIDKNRQK